MKKLFYFLLVYLLLVGAVYAAGPAGGKGTPQISNGDGTFGGATPGSLAAGQIRGIPPNQWSSLVGYGFRGNVGPAYMPSLQTYMGLLGSQMNVPPQLNISAGFGEFGCDNANTAIFPNSNPTLSHNPLVIFSPNPDDPEFGFSTLNVPHQLDTASCRLASLAWMGIPGDYKTVAQSSSCTATGSWTAFASYGGLIGYTSHTQGDTISCTLPPTVTGGPVYGLYELIGNSGGTFTYNIDGGANTTLPAQGNNQFTFPISTSSQAPAAFRALGSTTTTTHKVNYAITSTTTTGNPVTILGAAAPPPISFGGGNPAIAVLGMPYEAANQFAANTLAYDNDIKNAVSTVFADGISAYRVDVRNSVCCNFTSDMIASGLNGNPLAYSAQGQQKVANMINSTFQPQRNLNGAVDPRDYGASCNTQALMGTLDGASPARSLSSTQGSNVVCASGYTFNDGFATQDGGGGDRGRWICLNPDFNGNEVGPCTYIDTVNTSTNCASLGGGWAAIASYATLFAYISGHPTIPGMASTATDDTQGIQLACTAINSTQGTLGKTRIGSAYIQAPDNCAIANLACPGVKIQGNNAGLPYGNLDVSGISNTQWYMDSTGHIDSPYLAYDIAHSPYGELKDITLNATLQNSGVFGSIVGSLVNGPLLNESFVFDHIAMGGSQVDAGTPDGWGNFVGISANITGTTLHVLAITSTNNYTIYQVPQGRGSIYSDWLALGRTLTGVGVPANETILAAITSGVDGGVGDYLVSISATTTTEAMVSIPNAIAYNGTMKNNWFGFANYLWNGDRTDFTEVSDVLTGGYKWARYIGPFQTSEGNCANHIDLGREEECNQFGGSACDMLDSSCVTQYHSQQTQFPGGSAYAIANSSNGIMIDSPMIEGAGTCWSDNANKAAIRFYGSPQHIFVSNPSITTPNFGTCGGNTFSMFTVTTGSTPDYVILDGGDTTSNYGGTPLQVIWSGAGTIPPHKRINTTGRAPVDTTGPYAVSGALAVVTTSLVGGSAMITGLVGSTTASGVETISGLSPTQNFYDCSGKDITTTGTTFAQSATTSTSCALTFTGTANAGDQVILKAIQGN